VMKGRNADESGEAFKEMWDEFDDPSAIGCDATRFDQSVSPDALRGEHSVYLHVYDNDPNLAKLLGWQIKNRGFVRVPDGCIQYRVEGSRMSGDMNTGSGNVVIMCCIVFAFFRWLRRTKGLKMKWRLANNGDDCVIVVERCNEHYVVSFFPSFCVELGFGMEMETPVYTLEEIEFCQSHPVCVDGSWRMVRNLENTLAKDLVSTKPIDGERSWNMFRAAIADCGASLTSGLPMYQSFYSYLGRGAGVGRAKNDGDVTGMMNLARGMHAKVLPVADSTRVSFFRAFGVEPGRQRLLEGVYDDATPSFTKLQRVSRFLPHPALIAL